MSVINFDPLRGHASLYQCMRCWAVVHKSHMADHAHWHSAVLHVRPETLGPAAPEWLREGMDAG